MVKLEATRMRWLLVLGLATTASAFLWISQSLPVRDSGGVIDRRMTSYDVLHYDLEIEVIPKTRRIEGSNTITAKALRRAEQLSFHLDDDLDIKSVKLGLEPLPFSREGGVVILVPPSPVEFGTEFRITVEFAGQPYISQRSPWVGGFVWDQSEAGLPWVGVACQGEGGDLWWPCKDDPADEPDRGMNIRLTAPSSLRAFTNGRMTGSKVNDDGTTTSDWLVSYPINTYLVSLCIGPFVPVYDIYKGVDGSLSQPIAFWALPEHLEQAKALTPQIPRILEVLGRRFGEYPYLRDKMWVVDTPYLGMEHQTLVAYGAGFKNNAYGFDTILLHEIAHEWWGNKLSVSDWADYWLQEGFATYSEALYVEDTLGRDAYLKYMARIRSSVKNEVPLIQGTQLSSNQAYHLDVYNKGACLLHTLRYLIGDEHFFGIVREFITSPNSTHGRNVTTADFIALVERRVGSLDWFWDRYLYQAALPAWTMVRRTEDGVSAISMRWQDDAFAMPLTLSLDGHLQRLVPGAHGMTVEVPEDDRVVVDPEGWVLARRQ